MPDLDESNDQPPYIAGRLFAAYEQLQYDTYRARDGHAGTKPNTTFSDRYFAGALTSPRAVVITGGRDAQAWLKKLRGRNEKAAYHHQRVIANLYRLLGTDNPIPARMTPLEQATFLLGYHHQRAHQMPKSKTLDTAQAGTDQETTA
jgi:CRISPR-associated protein Csd1